MLLCAVAITACSSKSGKDDTATTTVKADSQASTSRATPPAASSSALPAVALAQFKSAAQHDSTTVETCTATKQFGTGQSALWLHVELVVSTSSGNTTPFADAETVITHDGAGQHVDTVGTASIDLDQRGPWTLVQATGVRAATQKSTPGTHTAVGLAKSPDLGPLTVNYPCPGSH